ncbi:glycosyltransferase [Streptomyces sp. NBC_00237]|uniref:glycosyltransferase family 2 protein n=1 Tax=Streptomyces sp. NBC_00237 TaxID=2975687 RepID=UPI002B1CFE55|nr:glycosyltransferase [Streptomyces sp. NBC_00237]
MHKYLGSVLHQDFTDFEILAVDDCSPDASGAILDEYAALDPRVRVLHLAEKAIRNRLHPHLKKSEPSGALR